MLLAMLTNFVSYLSAQLGAELTPIVSCAQNSALALLLAWLWLHGSGSPRRPIAVNAPV